MSASEMMGYSEWLLVTHLVLFHGCFGSQYFCMVKV